MPKTQGYLLPDGVLGNDEIACTLVFYPNRDEYRAALQGSLAYLATWIAWEKDSDKRGKDAAANWQEAYELTTRCWRMACLEQLQADVADILETLQSKKDCCDDTSTFLPVDSPTTTIDPGEGDPPSTYGETAVSDWDDWMLYLCFNAHAFVDNLIHAAESLDDSWAASGFFFGLTSALLQLLSWVGLSFPFPFNIVSAVLSDLLVSATATTFSTTAADLETARYDIVCAFIWGTSVSDAVEDALSSGTDWSLFFESVDYSGAVAVIYEGGWEGEYLPAEQLDDCDCVFPFPAGYTVSEADLITCKSGAPFCNGVSVADNTITLTGYTQTGGFRVSITPPGSVVGYITLGDMNKTFTAADNDCALKPMKYADNNYKQNGYTISWIHNSHQAAWQDWIDENSALVYPADACTPPDEIQMKNNAGGTVNGTMRFWHITQP